MVHWNLKAIFIITNIVLNNISVKRKQFNPCFLQGQSSIISNRYSKLRTWCNQNFVFIKTWLNRFSLFQKTTDCLYSHILRKTWFNICRVDVKMLSSRNKAMEIKWTEWWKGYESIQTVWYTEKHVEYNYIC